MKDTANPGLNGLVPIITLMVIAGTGTAQQDSLEAIPQVLWNFALNHSAEMLVTRDLVASVDRTSEAAGRIPDPAVRAGWSPFPVETRNGPLRFTLAVMQKIPWPGYLSEERNLASFEAEQAVIGSELTALALRSSVTELWAEMFLIRSRLDFLQSELERVQEVEKIASVMYETGNTNLSDLLRLENRIELIRTDHFQLELNLDAVEYRMNSLIGRDLHGKFSWPGTLPEVESFLVQEYSGIETSEYPSALSSRSMADAAGAAERLSGEKRYPSFEIGATWSVIDRPAVEMGAVDPGGDALTIFAGFSLPLGYSGTRYRHEAAVFSADAVEITYQQSLQDLSVRRKELETRISGLVNEYGSYSQNILTNLEAILSLSTAEWMTGIGTLNNVLEAVDELREAQFRMENIYSRIVVSVAKLKELVGVTTEIGEFL